MKIRHVHGAVLTFEKGNSVMVEQLGKGMFHTCYVDRAENQVYSITIEREQGSDYSKEILCGCDANPHIPTVTRLEDLDGADNRVYRMPLYQPLTAKNKTAWYQYKVLAQAKEDAWRAVCKEQNISGFGKAKMRITDIGYMVNVRIVELIDRADIPQSLKDAIAELRDESANYGSSYVMEFSKRNCMTDGDGTLILLDVLFSLETAESIQTAKRRKAEVRRYV